MPGHPTARRSAAVPLRLFTVAIIALLTLPGTHASAPGSVRASAIAIPSELRELTNEALIDRLQDEHEHNYRPPGWPDHSYATFRPAFPRQFAPLAARPPFDTRPDPLSPEELAASTSLVVAELIRRGVDALPALLDHLSDPRPTRLQIGGRAVIGGQHYVADRFDFRWSDPRRQSAGVNQLTPRPLAPLEGYQVRVGDICFDAVGQIVNRRLHLVNSHYKSAGMSVRDSTLNSPIDHPALAVAARHDWARLAASDHRQSLLADTQRSARNDFGYVVDAIQRLLFYYPDEGQRVAESLLQRRVTKHTWDRERAPDEISSFELATLLHALQPFEWNGLALRHYELFARLRWHQAPANAAPDFQDLLLQCARRAAGIGHDAVLRTYYIRRLQFVEHAATGDARAWVRRQAADEAQRIRSFLETLDHNSRAS